MPSPTEAPDELPRRILALLEGNPARPWCIHRLFDELADRSDPPDRDLLLDATRKAADDLASRGQARREWVSAISIGVHCQDSLYWSVRLPQRELAEFGPEYETPTILHRLASHFECHGL